MSYVSIREVTPHAGKESVLKERMKSISGIMSKHGAKSALYKVVAGEGAGRYDLQNWYSSLEEGAKSFQSYGADAAYQKIMQMREDGPAGDVVGPWIGRMVFGAPKGVKPVVVHRDYFAPRNTVAKALELAPKLQKLMDEVDVEVGIGVPMLKDDHEMLRVVYRFESMVHWGSSVDKMVIDDRFLTLVNEAHQSTTLKCSRMLVLQ
ncbi:MAG: hypothetical protein RI861_02120, partial [Planktomarina sp.]|jgi:hypothetical protein|nr:hypothetical protein [Planktomarina sp.]MDS9946331.1 hypothetical protein [Planktomarina sp.]|tara:strand:- start:11638 stop:12255 length:618 start_codon:yes stop_codon:yes gene_type:complete